MCFNCSDHLHVVTYVTLWTHIPLSHWRPSASPFFGVSTEILDNFIPCFLMFEPFQGCEQSYDRTSIWVISGGPALDPDTMIQLNHGPIMH